MKSKDCKQTKKKSGQTSKNSSAATQSSSTSKKSAGTHTTRKRAVSSECESESAEVGTPPVSHKRKRNRHDEDLGMADGDAEKPSKSKGTQKDNKATKRGKGSEPGKVVCSAVSAKVFRKKKSANHARLMDGCTTVITVPKDKADLITELELIELIIDSTKTAPEHMMGIGGTTYAVRWKSPAVAKRVLALKIKVPPKIHKGPLFMRPYADQGFSLFVIDGGISVDLDEAIVAGVMRYAPKVRFFYGRSTIRGTIGGYRLVEFERAIKAKSIQLSLTGESTVRLRGIGDVSPCPVCRKEHDIRQCPSITSMPYTGKGAEMLLSKRSKV